ncbi:DNA-binding protein [Methylobacterium sp. C33D]
MVDRAEIFRVADQMRGLRGEQAVRVSVRRVREKLKRRGSFGDVGKVLKDWRDTRNYQPVIELMQLPDALQKRLGDFGKALLDEVQASESRVRDAERANFEVERASYRELLDEAGMTVDVLEARVAALTAEVERLRKGGAVEAAGRSPEEAAEERRRTDIWEKGAALRALMARSRDEKVVPGAQEAFWRDVEREVLALVRKRGPMPAGDLLRGLSEALLNRGKDVEMPLSVGWLRFRLRTLTGDGGSLVERDGLFEPCEAPGSAAPGDPASWMVDDEPPTSDGDAVMRAVRDVLVLYGPMKPRDIVTKLPAETVVLANAFWKDGLDRFWKKMADRVGPKAYFHRCGGGLYAAGPGEREVAA